jgi:S-adenosyl methyltransferase
LRALPGGGSPAEQEDRLSEIRQFFDGLELAAPGIADISAWRPAIQGAGNHPGKTLFYADAGRKSLDPGAGDGTEVGRR